MAESLYRSRLFLALVFLLTFFGEIAFLSLYFRTPWTPTVEGMVSTSLINITDDNQLRSNISVKFSIHNTNDNRDIKYENISVIVIRDYDNKQLSKLNVPSFYQQKKKNTTVLVSFNEILMQVDKWFEGERYAVTSLSFEFMAKGIFGGVSTWPIKPSYLMRFDCKNILVKFGIARRVHSDPISHRCQVKHDKWMKIMSQLAFYFLLIVGAVSLCFFIWFPCIH